MNNKLQKRRLLIIISVVLLMTAIVIYMRTTPSNPMKLQFGEVYELNEMWTIEEPAGNMYTADLPRFIDVEKEDVVHISKILPAAFNHDRTLRIRSSMQNIQVKLDGMTIFDNTLHNNNSIPFTPVTSAWVFVDIPEFSEKSVLDIYIASDVSMMSGRLNEILYGSRGDLISELITRNRIGIFVIFFVFSVAIYTLIFILFTNITSIKRLIYLCVFSFSIGIWMVVEMDLVQIFLDHKYLVSSLSYLMLPLATIMFTLYLYEVALKKYTKLFKGIVILLMTYLLSSIMLQLIFDINYIEIISIFVVILSIDILIIIVLLGYESYKKSIVAKKYLMFMVVIFLTEILETVMFLIGDFNNVSSLSSLGIMIFLLLIIIDSIRYFSKIVIKNAESNYLRIIAYKDPLTLGLNRAAFERDIDNLLKLDVKKPFRVSMFDLNELKKINDIYGHEAGDEALKLFYEGLVKSFSGNDLCYRIGGDEFMVFQTEIAEETYEAVVNKFEAILKTYEKNKEYQLRAAVGTGVYNYEESFGEFKHQIDQKMYINKRKQKEEIL